FGYKTEAIGDYSMAMGKWSNAQGSYSVAGGFYSYAIGNSSTAFGSYAYAPGLGSVALGVSTNAASLASVALGSNNVGGGDPANWVPEDPIFEIGNGIDAYNLSNAMTVLKNGNVGIDISDPEVKLHITGGTDAGLGSGGYLQNGSTSGLNLLLDDNEIIARNNGSGAALYLNNDAGNIILAGGSTGNVGIRTSAPQEALHVEGTIEVDQRIQANDGGGPELATDEGTVRLQIADNGRVGIGTTSPSSILDIRAYDPTVIIDNTASTGNHTLEFQENSVFRGSIGYSLTSDYMFIYEDGTVMVQDGDLGVGVTSIPAGHRIHVSGGAYCTGTTWTNSSSKFLKENFQPVDRQGILDKLARIPVTEWSYKEEEMQGRHIGPMSEDFFDAFGLGADPAAISTVDIAGVTVVSVQALYERQQALEQENSEFRRLISRLQERLEHLEQPSKQK
ncbi:MAG: hypothetical protein R3330_03650, partial [Saprospiraceae bacterium]|nr:hypothetical protein [Saprospiraceae bacterium]